MGKNTDIRDEIKALLTLYDNIMSNYDILRKDNSEVDKELSDFYHKIEGMELGKKRDSHALMIELQDILTRRRELKGKITSATAFIQTIQSQMPKAKHAFTQALSKHEKVLNEIFNPKPDESGDKNEKS